MQPLDSIRFPILTHATMEDVAKYKSNNKISYLFSGVSTSVGTLNGDSIKDFVKYYLIYSDITSIM